MLIFFYVQLRLPSFHAFTHYFLFKMRRSWCICCVGEFDTDTDNKRVHSLHFVARVEHNKKKINIFFFFELHSVAYVIYMQYSISLIWITSVNAFSFDTKLWKCLNIFIRVMLLLLFVSFYLISFYVFFIFFLKVEMRGLSGWLFHGKKVFFSASHSKDVFTRHKWKWILLLLLICANKHTTGRWHRDQV